MADDLSTMDWDTHLTQSPESLSFERKLRMLLPMAQACKVCTMCELGLKKATKGDIVKDPHVFSNLNPRRFMVVGQGPGWTEVIKGQPFVGESGDNFNVELKKYGLSRDDFYICNAIRCFVADNMKPTATQLNRCESFLKMEMDLIKPKLVISLGAVAFGQLCPEENFSESLKKITKSKKFGVPVFAIYHPSPLNLNDDSVRISFEGQMKIMCGLVSSIKMSIEI